MSKDPKAGGACWHCRKPAAAEDNFCRFCGKDLRGFPWYYQHWGIILLTLVALGPFSVVLVWRSPVLSRRLQWVYTIALAALTYYLWALCYQAWMTFQTMLAGMVNMNVGF